MLSLDELRGFRLAVFVTCALLGIVAALDIYGRSMDTPTRVEADAATELSKEDPAQDEPLRDPDLSIAAEPNPLLLADPDQILDPYQIHTHHWSHENVKSRTKRQVTCSSGEWSAWDERKCAPCGGCGVRVRQCQDSIQEKGCSPKICVSGEFSPQESFRSKKGRYVRRGRRCCYNFNTDPAKWLPRPKLCTAKRCGGWKEIVDVSRPMLRTTCEASSIYTEAFTCGKSIDGNLDTSWTSKLREEGWIKFNFRSILTIVKLELFHICFANQQCSAYRVDFSDNTNQSISRQCNEGNACSHVAVETYDLTPTYSNYLKITCTTGCPDFVATVFREVHIWGYD